MMSVRFQHTAARRRLGWGVRFTTSSPTFQHTAARRRLVGVVILKNPHLLFQHTAARRRLAKQTSIRRRQTKSFNTQPPEGGWEWTNKAIQINTPVSTHSRPKAAGRPLGRPTQEKPSFNTQPPEGGWPIGWLIALLANWFQHTAARRRLGRHILKLPPSILVSTHSRPKAAGYPSRRPPRPLPSFNTQPPEGGWLSPRPSASQRVGFNTQPPEGGWHDHDAGTGGASRVSTHSRPKAAGQVHQSDDAAIFVSTHSRPKAAGQPLVAAEITGQFQHTAARRRLAKNQNPAPSVCHSFNTQPPEGGWPAYSKTASFHSGFNTQPPEGGWAKNRQSRRKRRCFNTQPPEGGWFIESCDAYTLTQFQHTAARRRLDAADGDQVVVVIVSTHSRPKAAGSVNAQ